MCGRGWGACNLECQKSSDFLGLTWRPEVGHPESQKFATFCTGGGGRPRNSKSQKSLDFPGPPPPNAKSQKFLDYSQTRKNIPPRGRQVQTENNISAKVCSLHVVFLSWSQPSSPPRVAPWQVRMSTPPPPPTGADPKSARVCLGNHSCRSERFTLQHFLDIPSSSEVLV